MPNISLPTFIGAVPVPIYVGIYGIFIILIILEVYPIGYRCQYPINHLFFIIFNCGYLRPAGAWELVNI